MDKGILKSEEVMIVMLVQLPIQLATVSTVTDCYKAR